MMFATVSYAQIRVSGRVADTDGNPLPGASVTVEGTSLGVMVDPQGSYSITVPDESTAITYMFLGYETVVETVGPRRIIDVVLSESSTSLDAVVAIGYGTRRVTDLTGSVGSVTSESIVARGAPSVMESLQGQIPGVNITQNSAVAGGGFQIQIRGQQTMGDANAQQPLYVVDGIVVSDINFLNPGDIERIDILKDASSAAIYGSRGSNGVVLVTTNQASSSREAFSISYDGYYGIREVVRTDDFMNGDEWMKFRMYAYPTRARNADNSATYSITHENMTMALGGSRLVAMRWAEKDYYDVIGGAFPNTATQNHFLNLNGLSGNTSYTMSMGYTREEGSYEGNDFERVNIQGGLQTKALDIVTLGFQTNLSFVNNDRGSNQAVERLLRLNPFTPPYDSEGNLIPYPMNNTSPWIASAEVPIVTGTAFSSEYNPLIDAANVVYNTRSYNVMANLFAEVSPVRGLKVKTQFSPMLRTARRGEYYGLLSDWSRTNGNHTQTRALVGRNMDFEYTWDNSIYYEWQSDNGEHRFDATGVYSVYFARDEETGAEGWNLSAPSFHGISSAKSLQPLTSDYGQTTMLSFIGRVNYSYKGKYLITATYRRDGSSRLGSGHKWDGFPSVAVAWRVSEEPFLKNWNALYSAKLRASFGMTGNNRVAAYSTMTNLDDARYYGFGEISATGQPRGSVGNTALGWEKSRELDFGLDVSFFGGRLSGTFDWYDRLSTDLLMGMSVPVELGMRGNSITSNVGSVRNRGIEVGLSGVIVNNRDWYWSAGLTFSRNRNRIVELYGKKEDVIAERRFIGQPINVAYTYVFDGIVDARRAVTDPLAVKHQLTEGMGIVKDLDGDGSITPKDRTITGSAFSDWMGSFTSSLSWRNLDFSFNIYADIGRYAVNRQLRSDAADYGDRGRIKLKLDYYVPEHINAPDASAMRDNWYNALIAQGYNLPAHPMDVLQPNTDARWPSYNGGGTYAPRPNANANDIDDHQGTFQDLSFVKVKNITLGYTLPHAWASKIRLQKVRLYLNVLNPWCFTDKDFIGFDPEWATAELRGRNALTGPAIRTWQFGLNVKF
jgi:TonB-linked SusC/RagA family outer membrane protein